MALIRFHLKDDRGISLIETLTAMTLTGIVTVAFLGAIQTISTAAVVRQDRLTAENLAKSQIEYIHSQLYDGENDPPQYQKINAGDIPAGFDIVIAAQRLDPRSDGAVNDDGLQKITVNVTHQSAVILSLQDYKMDR